MTPRARQRRGTAAIEYALVLPALLLMILGLVDWSWYLYSWLDLHAALGAGVRLAASSEADPEGAARAAICAALERQGLGCDALTFTTQRTNDASGPTVELTVSLPFEPPVGLVRTPHVLRAEASVGWYGWVYAGD